MFLLQNIFGDFLFGEELFVLIVVNFFVADAADFMDFMFVVDENVFVLLLLLLLNPLLVGFLNKHN